MKKIFLLLVAMISVSAHAQNDSNAPERKNWDRDALYGDVKSITIIEQEKDFYDNFNTTSEEIIKFNQSGDVTEYCFDDPYEGTLKYQYIYGNNRNTLEIIGYNSKGSIIGKIIYTYNERGQNDRIKDVHENKTYANEYDDDDNLTYQAIYNAAGEMISSYKSIYDAKGNMIEEIDFDGRGRLQRRVKYKYNEKGQKTESITYNNTDAIVEESYIIYDNNGNAIKTTEYKLSGNSRDCTVYTFTYDTKGRVIEEYVYIGDHREKFVFSYDSHNNRVLTRYYAGDKESLYLRTQTIYKIQYR